VFFVGLIPGDGYLGKRYGRHRASRARLVIIMIIRNMTA
jgi:hypothetical protein